MFVWQDESYVHHHHVWNKAWFNPKANDTVLRKGKGRRYVIVHAGCEDGWIGTPRVWVANSSSGDYHDNMNSRIFLEYMNELFASCKEKAPEKKFVFVLDNAKYHKVEHGVDDDSAGGSAHRSRSMMNKGQLADLPIRNGCEESKENLMKRKKADLYNMSKDESFRGRRAVEVAAETFGFDILWLPPYHPELNPIEMAWASTKQYVALENDGSDFGKVKDLILAGFDKTNDTWPKLVRKTKENETKYHRIIQAQQSVDTLPSMVIDVSDSDDSDDSDDGVDTNDLNDGLVPVTDEE